MPMPSTRAPIMATRRAENRLSPRTDAITLASFKPSPVVSRDPTRMPMAAMAIRSVAPDLLPLTKERHTRMGSPRTSGLITDRTRSTITA